MRIVIDSLVIRAPLRDGGYLTLLERATTGRQVVEQLRTDHHPRILGVTVEANLEDGRRVRMYMGNDERPQALLLIGEADLDPPTK
jgi:hypothetical protein